MLGYDVQCHNIYLYIIISYALYVQSFSLFWILTRISHRVRGDILTWYVYFNIYIHHNSTPAAVYDYRRYIERLEFNFVLQNNNIVSTTPYRTGVITRWHIVHYWHDDETSACEVNLFNILHAATAQTTIVPVVVLYLGRYSVRAVEFIYYILHNIDIDHYNIICGLQYIILYG